MGVGACCPLPSCPPNHKFGRRRHKQKCFSIDFCWRARIMRFVRQAIVLRELIAREEEQKPSQSKQFKSMRGPQRLALLGLKASDATRAEG